MIEPIELTRRIAHGFTNCDNYRLGMLLVADGIDLTASHLQSEEPP